MNLEALNKLNWKIEKEAGGTDYVLISPCFGRVRKIKKEEMHKWI